MASFEIAKCADGAASSPAACSAAAGTPLAVQCVVAPHYDANIRRVHVRVCLRLWTRVKETKFRAPLAPYPTGCHAVSSSHTRPRLRSQTLSHTPSLFPLRIP